MISIDFTGTFKNIRTWMAEYNKPYRKTIPVKRGKPKLNGEPTYRDDVSQMLRKQHLQLMELLVKNYATQLNNEQRIHGIFQFLPAMRTNNVLLAHQLNQDAGDLLTDAPVCSTRTIINLMDRLKLAGFITAYRFRGSTHSYEIKLKVELFSITKNGLPAIPVGDDFEMMTDEEYYRLNAKALNSADHSPLKQLNSPVIWDQQTSHKTPVVTNNSNVNNESYQQKTAVENGKLSTENQRLQRKKTKSFHLKDKNNSFNNINNSIGEIVEKSTISSLYDFFKGNTPKQKSGLSSEKMEVPTPSLQCFDKNNNPPVAAAPLSASKLRQDVEYYVSCLTNLMFGTIFSKLDYHAQSQVDYARQFLIDELSDLDQKQTKAKFTQLEIRIMLAYDWMMTDEDRYITVPTTYLNPSNYSGFIKTLIWHKNFIDNRRVKEKLTAQKQEFYERWNILNRAMDTWLKEKNYFAYQAAKNRIQKTHPEVVDAFDKIILKNTLKNTIKNAV